MHKGTVVFTFYSKGIPHGHFVVKYVTNFGEMKMTNERFTHSLLSVINAASLLLHLLTMLNSHSGFALSLTDLTMIGTVQQSFQYVTHQTCKQDRCSRRSSCALQLTVSLVFKGPSKLQGAVSQYSPAFKSIQIKKEKKIYSIRAQRTESMTRTTSYRTGKGRE